MNNINNFAIYVLNITLLLTLFPFTHILSQKLPILRIDPAKSYGGNFSEYFDSVEYIPLETTKESLFGDIYQLLITDSSYIVLDQDTKKVLFFSLSGKYITKKNAEENSTVLIKNDKIGIKSYHITNRTFTLHYYSKTGNDYNIEDKIKSTYFLQNSSTEIYINDSFSIQTSSCYYPIGGKVKDSTYYLVNIYKNGSLYKKFLPVNQSINVGFCALGGDMGDIRTSVVKNNALFLSTKGDYIIYKISPDSVSPMYRLIFPMSYTRPVNYLNATNQFYIDSVRKKHPANGNIITGISNIYFGKKTLHLRLDHAVYSFSNTSTNQFNFIYDTITGKLSALEKINPDENNFFLPFLDTRKIIMNGLNYKNEYFYSIVSSLNLFSAYEKNKSHNPKYPQVLQQYFKTQNRKSNPVIVKMKLKDF